jgi:hypothetical protein
MDVAGMNVAGMDMDKDKESLSALCVLIHIHPKTMISNP